MPFIKYLGRDLNPHGHYCPQDFKSCVSTNSTTKVFSKLESERKTRLELATPTLARLCSTN